jgi:tetratricopeptide (TPR) repeat protein
MQQWMDAITEVEKLIELYPDKTEYLHRAADYAEKAGDEQLASSYYKKILEIDPDDARANLVAAERFRASGEDESYLMSISPIMSNESIELDAKIAELLPFVEKYVAERDAALERPLTELVEILVKQYPDEAKVHALYGDLLYHSGSLEKAATEYEKTLVLDKSVYQVWEQLLQVRVETNDPDAVLRTSEDALNVFPNQGAIYYLRGLAYAYKEDFTSAETELQQALIMSGRNEMLKFNVLSLMSKVYFSTGELKKGLEALDKALKIQPEAVELKRVSSAIIAERATDPIALQKAHDMASEIRGSVNEMEVLLVMSKIAFKQEKFDEARTSMERAMDLGAGDDFLALELYGDILYSLGEVDKAVEYWTLSQNAGNQSSILKRKIAERKIVH